MTEAPQTPLTFSPTKAAEYLGIGRTKLIALIRSGRIEARDLDGRMRVTAESLDAFLASLKPWAHRRTSDLDGGRQ